MDKKLIFVLGVMTQSIVNDIHDGRSVAYQCVIGATQIEEKIIGVPDDDEAAMITQVYEYVGWCYGKMDKPEWLGE